MTPIYIFILAAMLPSGEMKFVRMEVPACPDEAAVNQIMEEKIKRREIIGWGGTCFVAPNQRGISS